MNTAESNVFAREWMGLHMRPPFGARLDQDGHPIPDPNLIRFCLSGDIHPGVHILYGQILRVPLDVAVARSGGFVCALCLYTADRAAPMLAHA